MDFSLVIPAYNEEKRLESVALLHRDFLASQAIAFEIILVPNHCRDRTPEIAHALAARDPHFRVVEIVERVGKGGAVRCGLDVATGALVGFVDADDSTAPAELAKIRRVAEEGKWGAAIGSRSAPGARILRPQPLLRKWLGSGFRMFVNLLFGLGISDTQCGAKVFTKNAWRAVSESLTSGGWEFDVEVLWLLKKRGFRVAEVPIEWNDSADSKVRWSDPITMAIGLMRIRARGFLAGKR